MFRTLVKQSTLLVAALLIALPASAGDIPPFCAHLQRVPATCEAEQAAPCTGACPEDRSNSKSKWDGYLERCSAGKANTSGSVKRQLMCASNWKHYFYSPTQEWVCCARDPFDK
jgi:hypothetical protein